YDDEWRRYDSTLKHSVMKVPAVHVGGWFDTFSQGTIDSFIGRQHKGAAGAKGNQRLVMGPWAHGGARSDGVGQLKFPNNRMPGAYSSGQFFKEILTDGKLDKKTLPVAYYVMGDTSKADSPGNEWRFAKDWPVPADEVGYYFHGGGKLTTLKGTNSKAGVTYIFYPAKPCPTVGGSNLVLPRGPMDQQKIESRDDVLVFTTGQLSEPVEVTGRVSARIFISSSAVDTDLSVRLCDVYPSGESYIMAEGMLRLRRRAGMDKNVLLAKGQVYEVTVDCWSTSIIFNKSHRIRVAVTSSNYPRFDINPGTGKVFKVGDATVKQTNTIHCSATMPSQIILPVVRKPTEK
ncbi:MAG TPA: CocE/NonD family hydrolase, partial [Phycisphaerae bacterium]|nr:CocE/NonD family hydrolase [Phycisphaerae bacterium]